MKESSLRDQVMRWLKAQPDVWVVKYPGGLYGRSGIPDILGACSGRFFAFELKTGKGRVSPLQELEIERIRRSGAHARVVRSLAEVQNSITLIRSILTPASSSATIRQS